MGAASPLRSSDDPWATMRMESMSDASSNRIYLRYGRRCTVPSDRRPTAEWGDAPFQNLASMSLLTASTTSADEYAPEVAFMTWPMILLAALSFFR